MITINFEDIFEPIELAEDLSFMTFNSYDFNKKIVLIKVKITPLKDQLLPNVYNLAFGPIDKFGEINDFIKVRHDDTGKMFSTILNYALYFLRHNHDLNIGLDG